MSSTTVTVAGLTPINSHHHIDESGIVTGLTRLPNETAATFRQRVLDVFVNKAGAHYDGLVNGANRELGYIKERAIEVNLRSGAMYGSQSIMITQTGIYVFSATQSTSSTSTCELSIDIYNDFLSPDFDYHARYIGDVVDIINANSSYFEASLTDSAYQYVLASTLVVGNSWQWAVPERIDAPRAKLKHEYIVPHTVLVNDTLYGAPDTDLADPTYIAKLDLVTGTASVQVDTENGYVQLTVENERDMFPISSTNLVVQYAYNTFPFVMYTAPVEVYEFGDMYFQRAQYELDRNQVDQYEPTFLDRKGCGMISTIIQDSHTLWGGIGARTTPLAADGRNTDIVDGLNASDIDGATFESSAATAKTHQTVIEGS